MLMLGVLVAVIIGVALYANREAFMPELDTGPSIVIAPVTRQTLPMKGAYDDLFDSVTFKSLKAFGDIPVTPGKLGSEDPFGEFLE